MNDDERWPGWKDEIKKAERERDFLPFAVAAMIAGIGWFQGEPVFEPDIVLTALIVFGFAILRTVLDVRVILIRHHWSMMRR